MQKNLLLKQSDFFVYFFIGGLATVLDWSFFWLANQWLHLHYQPSLVFAYVLAGIFHFFANKYITFKCGSKQIKTQYSVYIFLTATSLFLSMGIMSLLIQLFLLNDMMARIVTTLLMLVPNYLLHKYITFSKKLFLN